MNQPFAPDAVQDFRRPLGEALQRVSTMTETVYLQIAADYPSLIRELEVRYGSAEAVLIELARSPLETLKGRQQAFASSQSESRFLVTQFEGLQAPLQSLKRDIEEIGEDATVMEVVSLNAAVVAARMGEDGRAFGCITAKLKDLSSQTKALSEAVAEDEKAIGAAFTQLCREVDRAAAWEHDQNRNFLDEGRRTFEAVGTEVTALVGGLGDLARRSREAAAPLTRIMLDVQNQDRIRQSVDNVRLALDGWPSPGAEASLEARLDELCYLEVLPDLGALVLEEVQGQIAADQNTFQDALVQAKEKLAALEEERSAFLARNLENRGPGSLDHAVVEAADLLDSYAAAQAGLSAAWGQAVKKSLQTHGSVEGLVTSLRSLEGLLSQFRYVDLASRIQVARHFALASMKDNAAETTKLTQKLDRDVVETLREVSAFAQAVESLFDEFQSQMNGRLRDGEVLQAELNQAVEQLRGSQEDLRRLIEESRRFSQEFSGKFAKTEGGLGVLGGLVDEIQGQRDALKAVKAEIAAEKRRLLDLGGLSDWTLDPGRLASVVDRFTIFGHKKFAAGPGDVDEASSGKPGEITLF